MDAAFATVCRGFEIASERFKSDAPAGDEQYRQGVELMDIANATMRRINETMDRHNAELSGAAVIATPKTKETL